MNKKVVIIGAGFGGMSAACYLAKAGFDVTVVEKNSMPGGRAMVMKHKGFVFDMGPSWYMMPDVFEEFFADFGKKPHDYYKLTRLDPSYRVISKNTSYDIRRAPAIYDTFEKIEPGSGEKLRELLEKTKLEYEQVRKNLLYLPQIKAHNNLNSTALKMLTNPTLLGSYHNRVKRYIRNTELQQILEFMVVFMGGSPKNIPALYSLLTYADLGLGIYYPMGGFGEVAQAFYKLARSLGVTFKFNHDVTRIVTNKCRAVGVETENAGIIEADIVVSNADYAYAEQHLLDDRLQSYSDGYWKRKTMSPSGLLIFLGVKRKLPGLLHHNLFFDADWDKHFDDVYKHRRWTKDPLFYVSIPSKTDPTVAPAGMENLFILVPVASGNQPDDAVLEHTAQRCIARIEQKIGVKFQQDIVYKDIRAQNYFKDMFHAYRGNAFGLAHTLRQSAYFRPKMQSPSVEGLYHVGQYTNPGTGVPIVTLSGKVVSSLITQQWQKK